MKSNKQSVKQSVDTNVSIEWLAGKQWTSRNKNEINLPPNSTYKLIVDYPVMDPVEFKFSTKNGMGIQGLLIQIGKAYRKIYDDRNNKYGAYGHGIEDLTLSGIEINHNLKTIKLCVDS